MKNNINWEKVGVYIAVATLLVLFASKINDLGERISRIEGHLNGKKELIEEKK